MRSVTVLLISLCVALAASRAPHHPDGTAPELAGLFVVHRHGARLPVGGANASVVCGRASQCGQLVGAGTEMLYALGKRLVSDYGPSGFPFRDGVPQPSPRDTAYDPTWLTCLSTDVDRTLQSAGAMIRGVLETAAPGFGNGSASWFSHGEDIPVVHTKAIENERMLLPSDGWPTLLLTYALNQAKNAVFYSAFTKALLTPADLALLGRTFGAEGQCATDAAGCALRAQDTMMSMHARGVPIPPAAWALYPKVSQVLSEFNARNMYNASKSYDRKVGSKGYPLVTNIIEQMRTALKAPAGSGLAAYAHFSGHDTTLMPFSETIGNTSLTNTQFAGAFVTELWRPANASSAPLVRIRYGEPNQTFGSDHAYGFFYLGLKCITAAGVQYEAPRDVGCPLDEFARFVESSAPQAQQTWCYVPPSDLHAIGCLPGGPNDKARQPPSPYCKFYREKCPVWACIAPDAAVDAPQTHYLTPTFMCLPVNGTSSPSPHTNPDAHHSRGHDGHHRRHVSIIVFAAAAMVVVIVAGAVAHRFATARREYAPVV